MRISALFRVSVYTSRMHTCGWFAMVDTSIFYLELITDSEFGSELSCGVCVAEQMLRHAEPVVRYG